MRRSISVLFHYWNVIPSAFWHNPIRCRVVQYLWLLRLITKIWIWIALVQSFRHDVWRIIGVNARRRGIVMNHVKLLIFGGWLEALLDRNVVERSQRSLFDQVLSDMLLRSYVFQNVCGTFRRQLCGWFYVRFAINRFRHVLVVGGVLILNECFAWCDSPVWFLLLRDKNRALSVFRDLSFEYRIPLDLVNFYFWQNSRVLLWSERTLFHGAYRRLLKMSGVV